MVINSNYKISGSWRSVLGFALPFLHSAITRKNIGGFPMEWSQYFEQDHEPTLAEMISFVNNPLWIALQSFIEATYHIKPIMNYSRCSAQRGWNLKYRKSSKSLCVLYPMDGYFIALVVIGNKELTEAEAYLPQASPEIQELFARTPFAAGGRWLMIPVTSERILEDVKNLIQIRGLKVNYRDRIPRSYTFLHPK